MSGERDVTMCPECGAPLEIEVHLSSVMLDSSDRGWVGLWEHRPGSFVPMIDTDAVSDDAWQDGIDVDVQCTDEDCGWELRVGADGWEHGTRPAPSVDASVREEGTDG